MIIIKIKRSASGWAMGLGGFVKKKKKKMLRPQTITQLTSSCAVKVV